ncbi:MAG: ABC transporter permease [Bryobacterales bacterium]|jgi:putative ABC transport system permease protein|nr:ABC transporter permease [Bryobacterales bacterium]
MHRLKLFHRVILRPMLAQPSRGLLTFVAVALGVAVVIAIDLAGFAAAGSFRSSMESLAGKASLELAGSTGIPEDTLGKLATLPIPVRFEPRVEEYITDEASGVVTSLIGIDLVAHAQRNLVLGDASGLEVLDHPRAAWVGAGLGRQPGDELRITIQDRSETLRVSGVFQEEGDQPGTNRVVVVDLPVAQALTGREGLLDRVEVEFPEDVDEAAVRAAVSAVLPAGVELRSFGARTDANRRMLGAFRWNLRILSGIALVVGAFLIYNTISVSVVRRRGEIGVLRALGVTRTGAQALFLAEAAAFGIAGGLAGAALGTLMARAAVDLLAATVNALYVTSTPGAVSLSAGHLAASLLLGLGVSLAAAFAPAREAGSIAPVEAMARGRRDYDVRVNAGRNALWGALLLATGAAFCWMPPVDGRPLFGYLATLLLILGTAMLLPLLITLLNAAAQRQVTRLFGVEGLLAARSLTGSLRRSAVLVGALSTAVAMMASVALMVGSFRQTVMVWMDNQIQADIYLRAAAPSSPDNYPPIHPDVAAALEALPEVAAVDRFRAVSLMLNGKPATLGFGDSQLMRTQGRTSFLPGQDRQAILTRLPTGPYVVVSEPFSQKHDARVGGTLQLPLPSGPMEVTILGIFNDYSNERGTVFGDAAVFAPRFPRQEITSLSVYLRDGVSLDAGRLAVEQATANRRVLVFTNRSLRAEAIRIFDQTFAITWALEAVAIFVAVMGMAGALVALVMDRRRELSLLRFLGASKPQIQRLIYFEAGLLGMLSNVVGLLLGFALALILIYVINRQSFGWTFQFHWPGALLLGALTLIYAATLASAWFPARVATRLNPIEVIHEE